MKKTFLFTILAVLVISLLTFAHASENSVDVTLPKLNISINGTKIKNQSRQYPIISYKNTTYFPLTYNNCRSLGLQSIWNNKTGLHIDKVNSYYEYQDFTGKQVNDKNYKATIPTYKICINGRSIDNKNEKYPFLTFRGITYLPLTKEYCVDEFGWSYNYYDKIIPYIHPCGELSICSSSPTPYISLSEKVAKPLCNVHSLKCYSLSNTIVTDEEMYYLQDGYTVCRLPYDSIEPYPETGICGYGSDPHFRLYRDNNSYYYMTANYLYKENSTYYYRSLNDNSGTKSDSTGSILRKEFGKYWIEVQPWKEDKLSNMTISYCYDGPYPLGDSYLCYTRVGDPNPLSSCNSLYLKNDYLYLPAKYKHKSTDDYKPHVCRINIKTNKSESISKHNTDENFVLDGDYIYYFDLDKNLYKLNIKTLKEELIKINCLPNIQVLNGRLYYIDANDSRLYCYNTSDSKITCINSIEYATFIDCEDNYIICKFRGDYKNKLRFMVIDNNENEVFKFYNNITSYNIIGNTLYYLETSNKIISSIDLK